MDPTVLQRLPRSEYFKRRQYYLEWRKANERVDTKEIDGVTVEHFGDAPEPGSIILE